MSLTDNYFDHDADIGIIGTGKTIEECFAETARAMFSLMADLSHIHNEKCIYVEFEESDVELALVTWLNQLLAKAIAENIILSHFHIVRKNNLWSGSAQGEPWREDIERGIDVKGATLTMLSVKKTDTEWEARCVVDV